MIEIIVSWFNDIFLNSAWLSAELFVLVAFLECLPIIGYIFPGGTLVVGGGALAAGEYLNPWLIFIYASLGAMIGDIFSYSLGRWGGDFVRRRKIIKEDKLLKSEQLFNDYGASSVLWARFGGLTWATIPFISGSLRLNFRKFFWWNLLGAFGWSAVRVLLGYFSGSIIVGLVKKWSERLSLLVVLAFIIFFLYWLVAKHRQNLWRYYVQLSASFAAWASSLKSTKYLLKRWPIIGEFFRVRVGQERLLAATLLVCGLTILYLFAFVFNHWGN
jgi:membrane-associated protein